MRNAVIRYGWIVAFILALGAILARDTIGPLAFWPAFFVAAGLGYLRLREDSRHD